MGDAFALQQRVEFPVGGQQGVLFAADHADGRQSGRVVTGGQLPQVGLGRQFAVVNAGAKHRTGGGRRQGPIGAFDYLLRADRSRKCSTSRITIRIGQCQFQRRIATHGKADDMRFFALLRQAKHTAADGGQFLRDAGKRLYTAGHIRVPAVAYAGDDEDQALLGGAALGGSVAQPACAVVPCPVEQVDDRGFMQVAGLGQDDVEDALPAQCFEPLLNLQVCHYFAAFVRVSSGSLPVGRAVPFSTGHRASNNGRVYSHPASAATWLGMLRKS